MNEGNEMFEISMYAKEWKRNCLGIVFWGGGGGGEGMEWDHGCPMPTSHLLFKTRNPLLMMLVGALRV